MKTVIVTWICLMLATTAAHATGGFSCETEDANLKFFVAGTTGRVMGSPIVGIEAKAEIFVKGVPASLQKPDLSQSLVHHWLDHPELKLHFYIETTGTEPFASAELVINTTAVDGDDIGYAGDYRLRVFLAEPPAGIVTTDGVIAAVGKMTCSGE